MNTNSGEKRKESGKVGESSDGTGKTRRPMSNSERATSPGLRAPNGPCEGHTLWPTRDYLILYKGETRLSVFSPPLPFSLANVSTRIYL